MSLDLYIISNTPVKHKGTGVWVRDNGQNVELSPEKCKELYPDQEFPLVETEDNTYWHNNITGNLIPMATQVEVCLDDGIFVSLKRLLWKPHETGLLGKNNEVTEKYIHALNMCLAKLKLAPDNYKKYNPANDWGSYEGLVNFVSELLRYLERIEPENYNNYTVEANL